MTQKQIEASIREGTFREPVQTELTLFLSDQPLYIHNGSPVRYIPQKELPSSPEKTSEEDPNIFYPASCPDRSTYRKTLIAEHKRQKRAIQKEELLNILQPNSLVSTPAKERDYNDQHLALFPPE